MDRHFDFYPNSDSKSGDLIYLGRKPVDLLMKACLGRLDCLGFNTLGYLKGDIDPDMTTSKFLTGPDDGTYVHRERLRSFISRKAFNPEFQGWKYVPGQRLQKSPSTLHLGPSDPSGRLDPSRLLNKVESRNRQARNAIWAFDTLGYASEDCHFELQPVDGKDYWKTGTYRKMITVKPLRRGTTSKELCRELEPLTDGDGCWNLLRLIHEGRADYYLILQDAPPGRRYPPGRTVFIGNASSGNRFLSVHSGPTVRWGYKLNCRQLRHHNFIKTKELSCTADIGEAVRRMIGGIDMDVHDRRTTDGERAYFQYKYCLVDKAEHVWEAIIAKCLCFFIGPRSGDVDSIDRRAVVCLDADAHDENIRRITSAIENNEWSRNLEFISAERVKILDYYNPVSIVERAVNRHRGLINGRQNYKFLIAPIVKGHPEIVAFVHNYTEGRDQYVPLEKAVERMRSTGLLSRLDHAFIVNFGNPIQVERSNKVHAFNLGNTSEDTGAPTLHLLHHFAIRHRNCRILYVRTGFASDLHLIDEWEACIRHLETYDLIRGTHPGIWWAKSDHIRHLPYVGYDRKGVEGWTDGRKARVLRMPLEDGVVPLREVKYQIRCINLARREDRRQHMMRQFQELGLAHRASFHPATDGRDLSIDGEVEEIFRNNSIGWRRGVIARSLSHYLLWKQLAQNGGEVACLVLEDDLELANDLHYQINGLLLSLNDRNWNFVFLEGGRGSRFSCIVPFRDGDSGLTRRAYLISHHGAKSYVERVRRQGLTHAIEGIFDSLPRSGLWVSERNLASPSPMARQSDIQLDAMSLAENASVPFVVIMATYHRPNGNTVKYLRKSIQSVVNQRHTRWTLLVVGDKYEPEAELLEVLEEFARTVPNSVIYLKNENVERESIVDRDKLWCCAGANSFNLGLDYAKERGHRYYAHLDDDDYWSPEHLQVMATVYSQYDNCVFVNTRSTYQRSFLPKESLGISPNNFIPGGGKCVHSSISFRLDVIDFTYNTVLNRDPDFRECNDPSDAIMLNRIGEFIKGNPRYCSVYVPHLTCFHPVEGESKV